MNHYTELARVNRSGFELVVDCTPEHTALADCFDPSVDDIARLERQVDQGVYEWFVLRVRAMVDDHVLADEYLGGCLYAHAADVLTDGVAEDLIEAVIAQAQSASVKLVARLQEIVPQAG